MNAPAGSSPPVHGPVVVDKTYDLVLWLIQKVEKFPKAYRFSLGQRLVDTGLDLLLLLVEAAYRKDKRDALRLAGVRTNALRFLLRLAHDLRLLPGSAPRRGCGRATGYLRGRVAGGFGARSMEAERG